MELENYNQLIRSFDALLKNIELHPKNFELNSKLSNELYFDEKIFDVEHRAYDEIKKASLQNNFNYLKNEINLKCNDIYNRYFNLKTKYEYNHINNFNKIKPFFEVFSVFEEFIDKLILDLKVLILIGKPNDNFEMRLITAIRLSENNKWSLDNVPKYFHDIVGVENFANLIEEFLEKRYHESENQHLKIDENIKSLSSLIDSLKVSLSNPLEIDKKDVTLYLKSKLIFFKNRWLEIKHDKFKDANQSKDEKQFMIDIKPLLKNSNKKTKTIEQFIINVKDEEKNNFLDELSKALPTELGQKIKALEVILSDNNLLLIGNREYKNFINTLSKKFNRHLGEYNSIQNIKGVSENGSKSYVYDEVYNKIKPIIDKYLVKNLHD